MKPTLIILNGYLDESEILDLNSETYEYICCADGAYDRISHSNLNVDFILGDFDSIQQSGSDKHIHLPDQDYTDFEKIILYIRSKNVRSFHVIGCSGEEQDHFLGHLSIAKKYMNDIQLLFFDRFHEYFVTDKTINLSNCSGKMISVIPLPEVNGLTYEGMKYPVEKAHMVFGNQIGTRNHGVSDSVKITFDSGCVAIFKER